MKIFLTVAFGGVDNYPGKNLRSAHQPLIFSRLNDSHFDAFLENFNATLKELNISADLIQEVLQVIREARNGVLNQ